MGRCQSTPGLVESKDRTTVEEMWISPAPLPSTAPSCATQQRWLSIYHNSHWVDQKKLILFPLSVTCCNTVPSPPFDAIVTLTELASPTHPARLAHLSIAQMNVHEVELLHTLQDLTRIEMVNNFVFNWCRCLFTFIFRLFPLTLLSVKIILPSSI